MLATPFFFLESLSPGVFRFLIYRKHEKQNSVYQGEKLNCAVSIPLNMQGAYGEYIQSRPV